MSDPESTPEAFGARPLDRAVAKPVPEPTRWAGTLNPEGLVILASRSSGPGGQNVNKVSSKAQVRLNVPECEDLSPAERQRVLRYVAEVRPSLLTQDNEILVSSDETRSFHENRSRAIAQLEALITEALTIKKRRVPTRTPRSAIARRLDVKKRIGAIKRSRGERPDSAGD
jgi:ribosome-associated protein